MLRARSPAPRLAQLTAAAAAVAALAAVALTVPAGAEPAATLTSATWSVSASAAGATGAAYTYGFTAATSSSLNSVTMTVPAGTGGTPGVGAVSPASLAGGSVTLAGGTLTYSFTPAAVAAGTAVSIKITGLTNTATAGSYTSTVSTGTATSTVDAGTTGAVTLAAAALTSPAWSVSSTAAGATGVSYTYGFTTPSGSTTITSVTMTVPPGTTGTPAVGTVSPVGLQGGTVSLSGNTLTYAGITDTLPGPTAVSIQVSGLTSTTTAGSYTAEIVAEDQGSAQASGITPAVSFTGSLNLTSPASLGWAATLDGSDQSAVDGAAGDQQFSVDDETATGAGWHITVAATTFTSGPHTLADSGTLAVTGSTASATAPGAPSVTCVTSCTPPVITTTYPVAITTAASSPAPATVCDVAAGSGLGPVTLGGSGAASPVGWWVSVPASARAGSYTSTVTVAVVSGP